MSLPPQSSGPALLTYQHGDVTVDIYGDGKPHTQITCAAELWAQVQHRVVAALNQDRRGVKQRVLRLPDYLNSGHGPAEGTHKIHRHEAKAMALLMFALEGMPPSRAADIGEICANWETLAWMERCWLYEMAFPLRERAGIRFALGGVPPETEAIREAQREVALTHAQYNALVGEVQQCFAELEKAGHGKLAQDFEYRLSRAVRDVAAEYGVRRG